MTMMTKRKQKNQQNLKKVNKSVNESFEEIADEAVNILGNEYNFPTDTA